MDDILNAIKEALGEATKEKKRVPVGTISDLLLKAIKKHDQREDDLQEYIQAKLKLLAAEVKREMRPQMEALKVEHLEIWTRIYDELGLTEEEREANYSISMKTGTVARVVDADDEPNPFPFQ